MNTREPKRGRLLRTTLLFIILVTWACMVPVSSWAARPDVPPGLEKKLTDKAVSQGSVRVIVGLKLPGRPFELEGKLPDQAARGQQRARIAQAANALRGEMLPLQARLNRTYVTLPYMALTVDANGLDHLLRSPKVISIEEDVARDALNASATPFVGADSTWEAGYGGKGTAVAILDTGVDNDHPYFLGGGTDGEILRIVDEACFSTPGDASLCPNSNPEYGVGSADPTVDACTVNGDGTGDNICTHGTHVAGIAAGQDDPGDGSNNHDGIAPEAGIVSIQVFHRIDDCDDDTDGDQPCVRTFDSDYNAGLDWVQYYALPRHNVASANMSLGGGVHREPCSGSSTQTAIASLRSVGVATAVAAGNDGWTWLIGSPGCAPDAVTVGGVSDGDYGSGDPWVQTIWPYDVTFNMSPHVDIMASGVAMDSSEPDDVYGSKSGTSMATPQVAGAFAVLKAIDPSMSVDDAEQLLKDTGFLVMDQRDANPTSGDDYDEVCAGDESEPYCQPFTRVVKPLLQLNHAVAAITESDLGIYKDCKPDGDKLAEEQALCFLTITNYGDDAAMEVEVIDTYISDGSVDFTLGTPVLNPSDAGSCEVSDNPQNPTGQVTCDLGALLAGEVVGITIPVSVDGPLNVDDNATVTALTPDTFWPNNASNDGLVFYEDADLEVQKICKPDGPAVVGEETGSCEIFITNHGPSTAVNAALVDEIFSDGNYTVTSVTDNDAQAVCNSDPLSGVNADVECDLGDMNPGEVIKVTVVIDTEEEIDVNDLATATSDTLDSDTSNNSDQGSISFIVPTADLVVTKQCQPVTPAPAGTNATCEIFVYNNGPSTAEDVQLVDEIASDGSYTVTNISTAGAVVTSCPVTPIVDGDVECDLYDIDAGDTVSVTVTFTTNDEVDVNDIATATSDTYDPNPNNNTDTGSVTFTGIANLSVTKTGNPSPVIAGGPNLIYTIEVDNAGPSAAVNVVVTDFLPDQAEFVGYTFTEGTGSCVAGEPGDPLQPTQCGMGTIPSGGGKTVEIEVHIRPDARGTLHNDVSVSSDTYDDNNSDNQVTENTGIIAVTDISLVKSDDVDPVAAGGTLKYTLMVSNGGPSTATDVVLTDVLPAETSWVKTKVLGGTGSCLLSGTGPDTVTCTLNDMDPGESFMVVITVTVDPSVPDGTTITNTATVEHAEGDPVVAEEDTQVNAVADIWLDKTGLFLTENPSKTIRYTLTVHNDSGCSVDDPLVCGDGGPSDAQNVVVVDRLPSTNKKLVVTFVSESCEYDYSTHLVTCTTPTLAAGDTVYHEIEASPKGRLRLITNEAEVTTDTTDPNLANNYDEWDIVVGGGGQK